MVKTIKFNLILDGNPVRNLNELREHFNIDDILIYYSNGLLKKWLSSRGYIEELSSIKAITLQNYRDIIKELVNIFKVNVEPHQLEELLYDCDSRTKWRARLTQLERSNFQHQALVKSYCGGYDSLLKEMLEDKENIALLKSSMRQISDNYIDIFRYNFLSFYDIFLEKAPLAILVSLMNPILRDNFLSCNQKILPNTSDQDISKLITDSASYQYQLNKKMTIYKVNENNYNHYRQWYNLVNPDKKCLVLDMTDRHNVMVRHSNSNASQEFTMAILSNSNAPQEFVKEQAVGKVFNGLEFFSLNCDDYVKYLIIDQSLKQELINMKIFDTFKKYIKTFKGNTSEYWKDIEPKGKKIMIIVMREGNFVRSAGKHDEELSADDVNGKFPILDGVDYKSHNPEHEIGYLEV